MSFLGEGAHCMVYSASLHGAEVAVKKLKPHLKNESVASRDIEVEVELMRDMSHPNVLRMLGAGEHNGCRFLVLEKLHTTLSQKLLALKPLFPFARGAKKKRLNFALDAAEQLADSLVYAHDKAFPGHQVAAHSCATNNISAFSLRLPSRLTSLFPPLHSSPSSSPPSSLPRSPLGCFGHSCCTET